jgi:hypothetical protein
MGSTIDKVYIINTKLTSLCSSHSYGYNSLLEENLYGDEFELYAFELLGLYALELVAAKCIQECVEVLTALTELMQQNLQEDLPHRSSVGRALAAISLVTWNLQPLCVSIL